MAGPNASFTELATVTINEYSPELYDNVTRNLPLLYYIKQNGGRTTVDGGLQILENLEYAENATFKWFYGYEELSVVQSDVFTTAAFDWKQCNANVVYSGREVAVNSGPAKQFDLIKSKIRNAERTLTNNIGVALYYAGTENDGKSIGGLQLLVADDPTTGTVGGINRANANGAFYRNQIVDLSVENITISASTMFQAMNLLYRRTSRNADMVDVIVMGDTYHSYFESACQAQQQFMSGKEADVGFQYIMYKGAKVLYDPNCSATRAYALNTKYLKLKAHSDVDMKPGESRKPSNQDAVVTPLNFMGNLTCSNPSLQGVLHA